MTWTRGDNLNPFTYEWVVWVVFYFKYVESKNLAKREMRTGWKFVFNAYNLLNRFIQRFTLLLP